ncbi:MAG TPA: hypothetical protein VNA12_03930 [Mycobacteriales bacterium]|nr:hypothetical protein [Mycobacteriales bacterium]
MDDVQAKLDEIAEMVESAKSMPLSASCVVNRADLLGRIEELRSLLPAQMQEAQRVLKERAAVVAEGQVEADRIIADARTEAARLVGRNEVTQTATREAERLTREAVESANRMRVEVDDYVDTKLANFEVVLQRTITSVTRGRDKLRGRHELDQLRDGELEPDETPLPG